jgi:hypothetical protein
MKCILLLAFPKVFFHKTFCFELNGINAINLRRPSHHRRFPFKDASTASAAASAA